MEINVAQHTDYEAKLKQLPRPAYLIHTKSVRDLVRETASGEKWLKVAAICGFLATAYFVTRYFVGGEMNPAIWTGEQWLNAVLGLGIATIITVAQSMLYSSGYAGAAALAGIVLLVGFNFFTDISQSMERGDDIVKTRSEDSPVFQAALGSINGMTHNASTPIANPYATQLADAETKLAQCRVRMSQGKEKHCEGSQARVNSLKAQSESSMQATAATNAAALSGAINQAKALEYDESNNYAMIRFIQQTVGATSLLASFLFSLIIIGTFEYAFHFVGAYVSDRKRALMLLGRDGSGNPLDPDGTDPQNKRTYPAPSNGISTPAAPITHSAPAHVAKAATPAPVAQNLTAPPAPTQQNLTGNISDLATARARRNLTAHPAPAPQNLTATNLTVSQQGAYVSPPQPSKPPLSKLSPVSPLASKPTPVSPAPSKPATLERNAIAAIWEAISDQRIKRCSFPQCKQVLLLDGVTTDHQKAQDLAAIALDALEREGVVFLNPNYDPANPKGGFDKYKISKTAPAYMPLNAQA
jgi:hypothetical protein|nr:hypothetical protein [Thiothrix sp.]